MREQIRRCARIGSRVLVLAAPLLLVASLGMSASLERLSAEFQSQFEISTTSTPVASGPTAPGGIVVYDKTLNIPPGVAYITFSAQADTHDLLDEDNVPIPGTGAALLMSASVTDSNGTTVCQPMQTAGGAAEFGAPWMTLLKLPDNEITPNNCDDGGGGPADCHDTNIFFSCCVLLSGSAANRDVQIRLASSNGGTVFYEDSTIYIDRGPNAGGGMCQKVTTAPH